jgi:L-amino acid N-acyltransferase YncA
MAEPIVRPATPDDLDAIADIDAHQVRTGVATFEMEPPDAQEWRRRFDAVTDRGFVDAGRLTAVGFKHNRWLDTVLLQRTLNPDGR